MQKYQETKIFQTLVVSAVMLSTGKTEEGKSTLTTTPCVGLVKFSDDPLDLASCHVDGKPVEVDDPHELLSVMYAHGGGGVEVIVPDRLLNMGIAAVTLPSSYFDGHTNTKMAMAMLDLNPATWSASMFLTLAEWRGDEIMTVLVEGGEFADYPLGKKR
ncbi:MAG TPA: hypothetical protein VFM18_05210 [Methanosarcina sp.]|nr:hypothetical protein [Methanosarcina sp.]